MTSATPADSPEVFAGLRFDNTYALLSDTFYGRINPTPVPAPRLIRINTGLASRLGLDAHALSSDRGVHILAGNEIAPGSEPLAQAYAGHQFGYFNHQLGDGRAILLGEILDPSGRRYDIQLKGSGRTPFSRGGDGRAAVGPVIREYLVSEAMYALGIKTTRALAAVTTGESVYREKALPGAVLTRVASSHIRIGTFEYFWARNQPDSIKTLADYVIARHYPQAARADAPYLALLDSVMNAQAALVASWMHVGFVHGVMNTDNMSISGETIDYGPCAFIDAYDPATAFSSIDTRGRYAFGNQASIALWNLTRLAECLLPLIDPEVKKAVTLVQEKLEAFAEIFNDHWFTGLGKKIGLETILEGDRQLIHELLQIMQKGQADYTLSFRLLAECARPDNVNEANIESQFQSEAGNFTGWAQKWRHRLAAEQVDTDSIEARILRKNPLYIPRNHLVESVIRAAVDHGDYGPLDEMLEVLSAPFDIQPNRESYSAPPESATEPYVTFCGT